MTDKFFQGTYRTNTSYPRYSIVVDGNSANKLLYIATQDVPRNTPLTNSTYWIKYDVENGAITPEEILAMIKEITGDLDDLTTEDKTNLVSAINELVTGVDGLGNRVDTLEDRPIPVQSDWEQTDTTALDYIKNKPTISGGADWDAQEGEDGFIENKPFDVESESDVQITFNAGMTILHDATDEGGFNKVLAITGDGPYSIPIPSQDDVFKIKYDGKELVSSSIVVKTVEIEGEPVDILAITNDDPDNLIITGLGFIPSNNDNLFCISCISVTEGETIISLIAINDSDLVEDDLPTVELFKSETSVTKLSGDKIQIDGESIVSDNGVLKASVDFIYPVGIILAFANNTDPNDIYEGTTWEQIEGRFLLGSSNDYTLGDTGGEATHTLTEQEMPSHVGHLYKNNGQPSGGDGSAPGKYLNSNPFSSSGTTNRGWIVGNNEYYPAGISRGSGQAHNNMPPYEVVNYWKRTA